MKHSWRATIVGVAILACAPDNAPAQAQSSARLTINVVNGTAGGASVAGDEATLQLYWDQQPAGVLQAAVGEDGTVVFADVPTGSQTAAVASVKHQNMAFRSRPVALDVAGGALGATVEVFDVSDDTSNLSVGMHHVMIAARGVSLEFTEYMQLKNAADMAVTSVRRDAQDRPVVVEVSLPKGFTNLTASSYLERGALVVTPEGFYDTLATPPGEHQVTFSYRVNIDRSTMDITRAICLATSQLMVFWEQGHGKLEGLGEPTDRLVNAAGVPIEYYRRTDLKPGDKIAFRISGFNVNGADRRTWIILVVAFAAVLAVVLLRLWSKPSRAESAR